VRPGQAGVPGELVDPSLHHAEADFDGRREIDDHLDGGIDVELVANPVGRKGGCLGGPR
jgi:hypothetical protein